MSPDFSHGMSLQMTQSLQMVMTPQMIQSMEMLQLPIMMLEQRIQQELLENPALELVEMREETSSDEGNDTDSRESDNEKTDDMSDNLDKVDEVDYSWDEFYDDYAPRRMSSNENDEEYDPIEQAALPEASFQSYLEGQLSYLELEEREKDLCLQIIYNLDNSGYLNMPLEDTIDPQMSPPPSLEELEDALETVQELDPPGVGARSIKECLLLQIDAMEDNHNFDRVVVERYLDDVAANRLPQIARAMNADIDAIKHAANFIRSLNPHPGLDYGPDAGNLVQPDVIAELDDDGKWEVRLVNGSQPDVSDMFLALFDTTKRGKQLREAMLKDPEKAEEFKQMQELTKHGEHSKMLRDKYQSARWLVTAIAQRERTLLRVSKEIVDAQQVYLAGQSDAPAPLMMQQIAETVGIDISTVSRAVRDKYIDTPRGIKPLRMFFTRAVGGHAGGKSRSNAHIMNKIKEIIDAEDKAKPLKDDQIQSLLLREGIDIKRRTVAKYRTNLGFPSHTQRRVY